MVKNPWTNRKIPTPNDRHYNDAIGGTELNGVQVNQIAPNRIAIQSGFNSIIPFLSHKAPKKDNFLIVAVY